MENHYFQLQNWWAQFYNNVDREIHYKQAEQYYILSPSNQNYINRLHILHHSISTIFSHYLRTEICYGFLIPIFAELSNFNFNPRWNAEWMNNALPAGCWPIVT